MHNCISNKMLPFPLPLPFDVCMYLAFKSFMLSYLGVLFLIVYRKFLLSFTRNPYHKKCSNRTGIYTSISHSSIHLRAMQV